jgi:hypothetical protein
MAFGSFEDTLLGLVPGRPFSYSWHISFPKILSLFLNLLAAADWEPRSKPVIVKTTLL